jgi:uncharacterized protein YjiS (DUF1127 family)
VLRAAAQSPAKQQRSRRPVEDPTMTVKDKSSPPISSFELQRQASIERNLAIAAGMRATTKWLRRLVRRSRQMARDWAAERRQRSAIRELERLDDRALKDIGVRRCEIEFAVRNGLPARMGRKARQRAWSSAFPQQRAA